MTRYFIFESEMYRRHVCARGGSRTLDVRFSKRKRVFDIANVARFARGRCDTRSGDRSVHLIPVHADTRAHGSAHLLHAPPLFISCDRMRKKPSFAYVTARRSNREFVEQIARNSDKADAGKSCRVRMSDNLNFCSYVIGDVASC